MADTKISALSAETAAPGDEIPVNRGGVNYKITAGDILKQNSGTLTASAPALDLTQTWNASGVTFTGIKFNVPTDSSASGSLLMDLQVGGTSKFKVEKDGTVTAGSGAASDFFAKGNGFSVGIPGNVSATLSGNLRLRGGLVISWNDGTTSSPSSNVDLILARDAAGTLAQRNSTNAQTFRIYNTYTDASNYERGKIQWDTNVLKIGTEKAGTGTARALEFQTDGTTRLTIGSTGAITTTGAFSAGGSINSSAGGTISALGRSALSSPANGIWSMSVNAGGDFDRLQFGGTTSSFPALKRSSTSLIVRLADDSANAPLESASLKTDAPTGGTAATWKLGTVASVTPTSPDRTIEVDIGGTIYYLHAKTTND